MELQQQMTQNGQELQTGDVNNLGLGALMDDRLLADLIRLPPYNGSAVSKAILPFKYFGQPSGQSTVMPSGSADGSLHIMPFRGIVGSTTAVGTDALKNWRDIRSGVFVGGGGPWTNQGVTPLTTLYQSLLIAANSDPNARIDLIYAVIARDVNLPVVSRYVKNPSSGVPSPTNVVVQLASTVTIGVQQGTTSATPVAPLIPADGGGNYSVPLAYVRVASGFNASSTITTDDIIDAAPVPSIGAAGGASGMRPANQSGLMGGTVLTPAAAAAWANGGYKPRALLPSTWVGGEKMLVTMNLSGGTPSNWSHQNGSVVDDSIDWRYRWFRTSAMANGPTGTGSHFPWDKNSANTQLMSPAFSEVATTFTMTGLVAWEMGQSFQNDAQYLPSGGIAAGGVVCYFTESQLAILGSTSPDGVGMYVDYADGKLKTSIHGTTLTSIISFVVEYSAPLPNY